MPQFIAVKFNPAHERTYTYRNDDLPVSVGDRVEIETRGGVKALRVEAVDLEEPPFECKPILRALPPEDEAEPEVA